jgi:hypothetical protein
MFVGAPRPLSSDVTLGTLLDCAGSDGLGAWVRGGGARFRIYRVRAGLDPEVLASADLGFLLRRCARVAVREGERTRVLSSDALIHWRALQVATATPYLPDFERVRRQFPSVRPTPDGFAVALREASPEEILAHCVAQGIRVVGSVIHYGSP